MNWFPYFATLIVYTLIAYLGYRSGKKDRYGLAEKILMKSRVGRWSLPISSIIIWNIIIIVSSILYIGFGWFWFGEFITIACLVILIGYFFIIRPRKYKKLVDELLKNNFRMCPECLYSLAGAVSDGHCPECGNQYIVDELEQRWRKVLRIEGDQSK